jgi:hypothetical protein
MDGDIKMDLGETWCEGVDWILTTQVTDVQWAFIDMEMSLYHGVSCLGWSVC